MSGKQKLIGLIAEDNSDVNSLRILIHRIAGNSKIGVRSFVGNGCGLLRRKCKSWAAQLKDKGCSILILVHDLDRNDFADLLNQLRIAIAPCPIGDYLICIPIEELEAWLLSDSLAIKNTMNLAKAPKD